MKHKKNNKFRNICVTLTLILMVFTPKINEFANSRKDLRGGIASETLFFTLPLFFYGMYEVIDDEDK